ncbi:hypothetical protein HK102_000991 [Quaeritorhiza haematococci]|nr:hypothetical protein HK102_000991 [Quaeritorhiza haematococci]
MGQDVAMQCGLALEAGTSVCPPPDELYNAVWSVIDEMADLICTRTGERLFSKENRTEAKNLLEAIKAGYFSDPPGIPMYVKTAKDMYGLPVGTKNRTGKKYKGHYDIWLINEIQSLYLSLPMEEPKSFALPVNWINGSLYQPTATKPGIPHISKDLKEKYAIQDYIAQLRPAAGCPSSTAERMKSSKSCSAPPRFSSYSHLAKHQGTKHSVLPVHTVAEQSLFKKLMLEYGVILPASTSAATSETNCDSQPATSLNHGTRSTSSSGLSADFKELDWDRVAQAWNGLADGVEVFYKLPEHLKKHFKAWSMARHEENSLLNNQGSSGIR